ncbi:MAG TPA: hypothetical protein VG839_08835 [Asticcacaulis sp.]|nr:hypothetical protein [Asticcacaulis sp.]
MIVVSLPVLAVPMPPLLDYPNHVVRFWLLSGGAQAAPVSRFFAVDWSHTATNIGMDAFAAILGRILPAEIVGRVILGLAGVLPPIGACLVARRLFGRLTGWHVLFGLVAWPQVLLTGFMSLQLGLGAALIAVWLDLKLADQPWQWRLARQVGQGLMVLLIHPFGIILYLVLLSGLTVGKSAAVLLDRAAWLALLRRLAMGCVPAILALGVIGLRLLLFRQPGEASSGVPELSWYGVSWAWLGLERVFWSVITPYRSYRLDVDLLFFVLLWVPVAIALWRKSLEVHGGLLVAGVLLFLISVVCPQGIGSTSMVDIRLQTMAALVLPMAVLPDVRLGKRSGLILAGFALAVVAGRSAWLTGIWMQRQADIRSLYATLDQMPIGARLLPTVAVRDPATEPIGRYLDGLSESYLHQATLAVMRRQAYVPTVFAESGKQPLRVLPPFDEIHEMSGGLPVTIDDLQSGNTGAANFLSDWQDDFDYVLVVNGDEAPVEPEIVPGVCLVANHGFARLYRIAKAATPCPA